VEAAFADTLVTETMAAKNQSFAVIIGAGPSGLTLAIALAHHRIRVC